MVKLEPWLSIESNVVLDNHSLHHTHAHW